MKNILAIPISFILTGSLLACGNQEGGIEENTQQINYQQEAVLEDTEITNGISPYINNFSNSDTLIVYFSRVGNTEYPDDVVASTSASIVADNDTFGTTGVIANIIRESTGGDIHLIQTKEPYPSDFDALREQNHDEMNSGYLPLLKESDLNMDKYSTVFIGYPVWATDVPQAVLSFLSKYDLSEKTVIPFCTHDGYGAGGSYNTIAKACGNANVLEGLAIDSSDISSAQETVETWLNSIGIENPMSENSETAINIKIGNITLNGVIYDTALAHEITDHFPLSVSMVGYGGREYYGGINFVPENASGGQLNFENGHITYCGDNNTIAIFYAQTDRPNLTMEVIPIGKVTSDLSVFDTLDSREDITFSITE